MVAFLQSAQATAEKEQTKLKFEVKGCGRMMQSRNNESIDVFVILFFWWFHSMFLEALKRAVDSPSLSLLVPTFLWRKPTEKLNKQPWSAMFGLHCNASPSKATRSLEPWKAGTMTAVKLC